jgi:hypothetical protein
MTAQLSLLPAPERKPRTPRAPIVRPLFRAPIATAPLLPTLDDGRLWHVVERCHPWGRALADSHYSRQTPGARDFMGDGQTLVLVTLDGLATWGAIENRAPVTGELRWRCAIFSNRGPHLSSTLIREATEKTRDYWRRHYGGEPAAPLRTEVDPTAVRHKRDPGRCFKKAGWRLVDKVQRDKRTQVLFVFEAPLVGAAA